MKDRSLKRAMDLALSSGGLMAFSPVLLPVMFLVWLQDRHSPFYVAPRVGMGGKLFKMVKLRSMIKNADKSGVDSTAANDLRITQVGHFIRKFKLDEITQLWNVFLGEMSLVGPRPQVERDVALYTNEEQKMLRAKPGITDFASIVFADEGEILKGAEDPDLRYNQIIRPWKSRLALFYLKNQSAALDAKLIALTALTLVSRKSALEKVSELLKTMGAPEELVNVAKREGDLQAAPPPGAEKVVHSRKKSEPRRQAAVPRNESVKTL